MQKTIQKWLGTYINIMAYIAPAYAGKLGFKLFGRPIRKKMKPGDKRFLNSSEKFSFYHKDLKIQGYRWGDGPKKILLLHGWQSNSARWKQVVRSISKSNYTMYAFDAPGHGLSEGNFFSAPLYGEVILTFARKAGKLHTIVGHSLGGFSTLYVISQYKHLEVDRLIIMATPGEVNDFVTWFKQRLNLSDKSVECIRNHFIKEIGHPYEEFSISKFAEHIDLPGLIIHDKTDRFAPFQYAKTLNRMWNSSKLLATEGMGHHLYSKNVVKAITDYISNENIGAVHSHNN